jgi:hypothetical protein
MCSRSLYIWRAYRYVHVNFPPPLLQRVDTLPTQAYPLLLHYSVPACFLSMSLSISSQRIHPWHILPTGLSFWACFSRYMLSLKLEDDSLLYPPPLSAQTVRSGGGRSAGHRQTVDRIQQCPLSSCPQIWIRAGTVHIGYRSSRMSRVRVVASGIVRCSACAVLVVRIRPIPYSAQPHPRMPRLPHRPYAHIDETPTRR